MSEETLFISDCHLDASRPEVLVQLVHFLDKRAAGAARLFILGDLFEAWVGDDNPVEDLQSAIQALQCRAQSTPTYFLGGNRDFLLGQSFAEQMGFALLEEPHELQLGDLPIILIHGDTLCTDDHDYQAFRGMVRNPDWQAEFLNKPLAERMQMAAALRKDSAMAMAEKSADIMDVNQDAVVECFDRYRVDTIIHGHTHRPAVHHYASNRTRYVLGDWNPHASYLSWKSDRGFELVDPRI